MAENDTHYNGNEQITPAQQNWPVPEPSEFPPSRPPLPWESGQMNPGNTGGFWPIPESPFTPPVTQQQFGQVRFLNASTYNQPVNIAIDNTIYSSNSHFGLISEYGWVADGFHTVTVRRASGARTLLYQQTFPFVADQKTTMVLTDSPAGGLDMISVSDTGCTNLPYNVSCYRFANMSYSGSNFDLMLSSGEVVFRDIDFQATSTYKQAVAGTYQFSVVNANAFPTPREMPIIVIGSTGSASTIRQPLVTFTADLTAGRNFTSYVIGNTWSEFPLQVLTVADSYMQPVTLQPFITTS